MNFIILALVKSKRFKIYFLEIKRKILFSKKNKKYFYSSILGEKIQGYRDLSDV